MSAIKEFLSDTPMIVYWKNDDGQTVTTEYVERTYETTINGKRYRTVVIGIISGGVLTITCTKQTSIA